jgi:ATP-dependent DNA helicase RecG
MAPTEILAEQHFRNATRILGDTGYRIELLVGSTKAAAKRKIYEQLAAGGISMVVGTHAIIQEGVAFDKLGLAVIDEQHRFGVMQRAQLRALGLNPDVLVMTATPIPRSLAMTVYGDLDVSIIDEMPPGRTPIKTSFSAKTNAAGFTKESNARSSSGTRSTSCIRSLRNPPRPTSRPQSSCTSTFAATSFRSTRSACCTAR